MTLKLKKILLIGRSTGIKQLYGLLSDSYNLVCIDSTDTLLENWNSFFIEVIAVIIDSEQALKNNYDFLKKSVQNGRFSFVPLLVITNDIQSDEQLKCLDYNTVDFITMPFQKATVKNRRK